MKLLYIVKQGVDSTLKEIAETQKKEHEVEIIELNDNSDYDSIVDQIADCDRVISW